MSQHATPKDSGGHHTPVSQTIVNENAADATSSQPALRVSLLGPLAIEQANGTLFNLDSLLAAGHPFSSNSGCTTLNAAPSANA